MRKRSFSIGLVILVAVLLLFAFNMASAQAPLPPAGGLGMPVAPLSPQGGGPGPIGTGFTYQGQLKNAGGPVNATCDFQFTLWDEAGTGTPPTGGVQIGGVDGQSLAVSQGLFTAVVDAGNQFAATPPAFQNADWLQIAVRCPSGSGSFTTLSPRQPLWAAPYASGLRPGSMILGSGNQVVTVQSAAPSGGSPAAIAGEMLNATDGYGVQGTGQNGSSGVLGQATGSSGNGVHAVSGGNGIDNAALYAEALSTGTSGPAGIAVFGLSHSDDSAIVAQNTGSGPTFRALDAAGDWVYEVTATGRVVTTAVQVTGGGDLAERFDAGGNSAVEPGTLMVIDPGHPGQLRPSSEAYDPDVAGVVSGAGGIHPGLTLQQQGVLEGNTVVAIAGRVYVKAEASTAPIRPGDLLTSSAIPGYAMKAVDRQRAAGAIIGKAMTGLKAGQGLVLILVSLQ